MIGGDHDPDHRGWLTLGLRGLAVAAGDAGAQVVVSGICQFDALEDPEDRPPSVVHTMLSGPRPAWLMPGPGERHSATGESQTRARSPRYVDNEASGWEVSGNPVAIRCYRADPRKWCHTLNTVDILVFPQSPGGGGGVPRWPARD